MLCGIAEWVMHIKRKDELSTDIRQRLFDQILPLVSKPGRYIGNEINIVRKNLNEVDTRIALVFPDVYEVGMSYLGFPILYNILNHLPGVYAERVFAPWVDMEAQMRAQGIPLFSLETFSPIREFDIIGFTLQYEMHYTSIINLIDLAGLPVEAGERNGFPLIIGGGPCAFNPEPVAEFFDALLIGDGEDASVEIVQKIREARQSHANRLQTLKLLSQVPGIYVPEFYRAGYGPSGNFTGLQATVAEAPRRIKARMVESLKADYYPQKPLVPMIETAHDRVSMEITRGCSRGCRFCNAGIIYRPVRERSVADLLAQAEQSINATGYDEVSLVSLSTSDYSQLGSLLAHLQERLNYKMVNISFPSLRPEKLTPEVTYYAKGIRKSGLTLAPEAGTQRLRDVINKSTKSEDLLRAVDLAFREGWNLVKLYFMIGQPSETDEDLEGLAELIMQVAEVARIHRGRRINVSISPFVPKAHTPFQWVSQDSLEETERKIKFLRTRITDKNVKLSWRDGTIALIEGVLARGDRRMAKVIKRAWQSGAHFDGWGEFFNFQRWRQALAESDLDLDKFLNSYDVESSLPWDHINKGVSKKFLRDEYQRSLGEEVIPDCRDGECNQCGLMGQLVCREILQGEKKSKGGNEKQISETRTDEKFDVSLQKVDETPQPARETKVVRVKYRRGQEVKFLSHLDIVRVFERAMRRAGVPVAYTEGFNPHPKIAYGPSLATGFTSAAEYFDMHYYPITDLDLANALNPHLPRGLEILEVMPLFGKSKSLAVLINRADYQVILKGAWNREKVRAKIEELLYSKSIVVERTIAGRKPRPLEIRRFLKHLLASQQGVTLQLNMENGQTVRVDEVLRLLFPEDGSLVKTADVVRTGLWIQYGDLVASPMEF
jgi:radical SAM family uncharacterized protein/radical SAM-linked protein